MIAVGVVEKPLVTDVVKAAESRKCAVEFYTKDGDAVERVKIKTFDVVERLLSLDNDGDGKRDLCNVESFKYFDTFSTSLFCLCFAASAAVVAAVWSSISGYLC